MMKNFNLIYARHNTTQIPPHGYTFIPYYDLTLLLSGSRTYEINGNTFSLQKGDVILIQPNSHRNQLPTDKADYISFNFTCDEAPLLPVFMESGISNAVKWLLIAYDELAEQLPLHNAAPIGHIIQSILAILDGQNKQLSKHPLAIKIEAYLLKNQHRKITLAEIGEVMHYSPVYCDIIFKRETGQSIIEFLIEQRLLEAKKLLSEGLLSLKEIAEATGFEDYNYFARIMKKKTGYTPTKFRNHLHHI